VCLEITMPNYDGLPAAANVEQAIILAQLLIRRDLERGAKLIAERPRQDDQPVQRKAA
jgi:hypothetical protein